jgi:multidrug transporter EmrE-like cation transporter
MNGPMLLLLCLLLSAAASYFLKLGAMAEAGNGDLLAIATNPMTMLGGAFYAATFALYALALQKVPLSLAQPVITSGASVVTAILSVILLRESMGLTNWLGLVLVCTGVYLLFFERM